MRRGVWLGFGSALLVLGCGGDEAASSSSAHGATSAAANASGAGGGAAAGTGAGGGSVPPTEDRFEPPPAPASLPQSVLDTLAGQIDAALDAVPGATELVQIVGAETGQTVYERAPDKLLMPASNTKLFTTSAAMVSFGEKYRLRSTVYATDDASDGVVSGDLVLLAAHDYTLSSFYYGSPRFPLDVLADELAGAGLTQVTGNVQARGEFVYEGDELGTYDAASERAETATAFRAALVARGIAVGGGATSDPSFDPPAGAKELAHWETVPLALGEFTINVHSHNEFADILSHHLGYEAAARRPTPPASRACSRSSAI